MEEEESQETTPKGTTVKRYSGRGWLLLEAVAGKLNFTVRQRPTKDWTEVMDRVKDRSAYISPVAYVVMPHQLETVDYTVFIEPDTLTFSMATPSLRPRWEGLYYPLRPWTWLLIMVVLAALPFALFTVNLMVPLEAGGRPMTLPRVTQELTGSLLGQTLSGRFPSSSSVRLFLGTWLVYVLILTTGYRSNLTAFLTVPKYPPRVETLHQLIQFGARVTVPLDDGDDLITFFRQSGSRDFQLLAERTYKVRDTMTGLRQATGAREAYVYVRRFMEALIAEHFTDVHGRSMLYVAQENISPGFAAWPILRDAPFKPALDWCLTALLEAGLSEKWMSQMLEHTRRESRIKKRANLQKALKEGRLDDLLKEQDTSSRTQPLTVVHMQGPLFLLILGLLLSLASFLLELLTEWFSRSS
ncbi:ionotropic receptor 21a-like [Panulirus ornatus]|uniref:ionotropic receptor 21a-like n=1 Tax=Panulirus ornatus TaxID=150431 RepID=UPI003A8AC67E